MSQFVHHTSLHTARPSFHILPLSLTLSVTSCSLLYALLICLFSLFIRQADVVGRLKLYCCPFFIIFISLLALRSAKRCSGRPSNVCRRFGHMHHYSKVPRHLPHPSPNFYRGSKSAIFGLIAQQRSTLGPCGLETEQDISTVFKLRVQRLPGNVPSKFGADRSTRFSNHLC